MSSTRCRIVASAALLAALGDVDAAHADPSTADKALADSLFQEAKRLMTSKKWSEACPKLAESQRLDPATGTLLNLAVCHESEGKTATAWVEFGDALAQARTEKRPERVKLAQDHIAKLEPRLSRLSVVIAPDARVPGLMVAHNGASIPEAGWGTVFPVDPGLQKITASATGKKPWENRVNIAEGETRAVPVPALDAEVVTVAPRTEGKSAGESRPPQDEPPAADSRRTVAYVLGGAGLVLVGVGAYFGVKTLSQKSDSDAHCAADVCDAQGVSRSEDAHRSANVADVGLGLGVVALGVGTYLFLTSSASPAPASARGVRVTPAVGRDRAGLTMGGSF